MTMYMTIGKDWFNQKTNLKVMKVVMNQIETLTMIFSLELLTLFFCIKYPISMRIIVLNLNLIQINQSIFIYTSSPKVFEFLLQYD